MILIHPYAKNPNKQWGMQNWIKLVGELINNGHSVTVVGISNVSVKWSCGDLTNKTSLYGLRKMISISDLLVTVDGGPMHMAIDLGRPCVALFGNVSPAFFVPDWSECRPIYHTSERADMPRKVSKERFRGNLDSITVKEVVDAIQEVL